MASNHYEGINYIEKVDSENKSYKFVESVNKRLEDGYKLLHVGTEARGAVPDLYHVTVAVLGKKLTKKEKEALRQKKTPKKYMPSMPPKKGGSSPS